jgi:hypothetical protein
MTTRLYTILENITTESVNFQFTEKYKAAGYHSVLGSNHTAIYDLKSFLGVITIQGTLLENPGEYDWVDINDTTIIESNFPTTTATSKNFQGNFVWIRAKYQLIAGEIQLLSYNY